MRKIFLLLALLVAGFITEAQVYQVIEENSGNGYSNYAWITGINNSAYFWATRTVASVKTSRLYKNNGAPGDNTLILESDSIDMLNTRGRFVVCNNKMYFLDKYQWIWVSDGTSGGTHRLSQVYRDTTLMTLDNLSVAGDDFVYVRLSDKGIGKIDAHTDAIDTFYTPYTSVMLLFSTNKHAFTCFDPYNSTSETGLYDLNQSKFLLTYSIDSFSYAQPNFYDPNVAFLSPTEIIAVGGNNFTYPVRSHIYYYNLATDTKTLLAVHPRFSGLSGGMVSSSNGKVFFNYTICGANNIYNREDVLYVTDGTLNGTSQLDVPGAFPYSSASSLKDFNTKMFFKIDAEESLSHKEELWVTDGTQGGMQKLMENDSLKFLYIGAGDTLNGEMYFSAHLSPIWKTDGTNVTTAEFCSYNTLAQSTNFENINGQLYFTAKHNVVGTELWATNGANCNVVLLNGVGVHEVTVEPVSIYPNPVSDLLTIELPQNETAKNISLTAVDGKVLNFTLQRSSNNYQADVSGVVSGIYMVKIETESAIRTARIVKLQ